MTLEEMERWFDKEQDDAGIDEWADVDPKRSPYRDVHAFLLLVDLVPPITPFKMVSAAEHDQIWLDVKCEDLAAAIKPAQIRELVACGVCYDSELESLYMFA